MVSQVFCSSKQKPLLCGRSIFHSCGIVVYIDLASFSSILTPWPLACPYGIRGLPLCMCIWIPWPLARFYGITVIQFISILLYVTKKLAYMSKFPYGQNSGLYRCQIGFFQETLSSYKEFFFFFCLLNLQNYSVDFEVLWIF